MHSENMQFAALSDNQVVDIRRRSWGRLFGFSICAARMDAGLTIERAAELAGMEVSEWAAIEEGHVPQDVARLRSMAAALEIGFEKVANMVLLCRGAWEQ